MVYIPYESVEYNEGYNAFIKYAKELNDENYGPTPSGPYPENTSQYKDWKDGWNASESNWAHGSW